MQLALIPSGLFYELYRCQTNGLYTGHLLKFKNNNNKIKMEKKEKRKGSWTMGKEWAKISAPRPSHVGNVGLMYKFGDEVLRKFSPLAMGRPALTWPLMVGLSCACVCVVWSSACRTPWLRASLDSSPGPQAKLFLSPQVRRSRFWLRNRFSLCHSSPKTSDEDKDINSLQIV